MSFDPREYWNERLKKHYDLVGVGDISLSMNYNKWSYKVTQRILKKLFKKYTAGNDNNKVLDIGPGTGFVVGIWKELNKEVTGVDISIAAVENLRKIYPEDNFVEFDMGSGKINIPAGTYSCCSAASVLYHIVDDIALDTALGNIHNLLEKDGFLIFSDNFIHKIELNITHQKCRTLDEYKNALQRNGFEIIDRLPNYVLMNDPVDARGKFYPRLWSRTTALSRNFKWGDAVIWPLLYPLELVLTSVLKESPAQEFMICRAIK